MESTYSTYTLDPSNERFSLFDLDENETYLRSIRVVVNEEFEHGMLHLNSRSIIFDPDNETLPLIKIRYNSRFDFECLSFEQVNDLYEAMILNKSSSSYAKETAEMRKTSENKLTKNSPRKPNTAITNTYGKKGKKTNYGKSTSSDIQRRPSLPSFRKMKSSNPSGTTTGYPISDAYVYSGKAIPAEDKSSERLMHLTNMYQKFKDSNDSKYFNTNHDFMIVNVYETYLHPRKPRGGFNVKKENDLFLFIVNEPQDRSRSFWKALKYLYTEKNPDIKAQNYIEQLLKNEAKEIASHKEILGDIMVFNYRANRILTDGFQTGYFSLWSHPTSSRSSHISYYIEYIPFINNTPNANKYSGLGWSSSGSFRYSISDITEVSLYRYMFKYNAVLLQINSKHEIILSFDDKSTAESVLERLQDNWPNSIQSTKDQIEKFQKMWINGWISNYDYLLLLNKLANRSFNDISQYPIMPWVLKQYSSSELDFDNPRVYRDLEKPIGALNEDKLEKFKNKYYQLVKLNTDEQPYMYSSHYSSSSIVLYYLIRNIPPYILRLQNTGFGPSDRIFLDIQMWWNNCLNTDMLSDLKELTPEFYSGNGSFLKNNHNWDLGYNHLNEKVEDVGLPSWAESPLDFIIKMRQALDDSNSIHHWIDLIFGDKQKGEKALYANNLFNPMSYEENVKLDECTNEYERAALETQIQGFGQTPIQLFTEPHPKRLCRKLLIYQPTPGKTYRFKHVYFNNFLDTSNQETVSLLQKEIDDLASDLSKAKKKYEDAISKQYKKFEIAENKLKKKNEQYKKEIAEQTQIQKSLVDQLKIKSE